MADLFADPQVPWHSMNVAEIGRRFQEAGARFDDMAEAAFEHQREWSPTYRRFAAGHKWSDWATAPFLPVEAFKWPGIVDSGSIRPEVVFSSSGTGGKQSRHPVIDLSIYERSVAAHFVEVFGGGAFRIAAHLPTYRRSGETSSLLHMVDLLMRKAGTPESGFALDEAEFDAILCRKGNGDAPVMVFGTAFGLLDMVEKRSRRLPPTAVVVETGGMKTYRRNIARRDLHERLAEGFGIARDRVMSEYGMCELLSQCYTRGGEIYYPPSWMRFRVVDVEDPELEVEEGYPGLLALFDLANIHSVSAILTSDLAIQRSSGFELVGRADAAEIRGCNFLVQPDQ